MSPSTGCSALCLSLSLQTPLMSLSLHVFLHHHHSYFCLLLVFCCCCRLKATGLYAGYNYCQSHMFWWSQDTRMLTVKPVYKLSNVPHYTHFQSITNNIYGFGRPFLLLHLFYPSPYISTRPYSFLSIQMTGGRVST